MMAPAARKDCREGRPQEEADVSRVAFQQPVKRNLTKVSHHLAPSRQADPQANSQSQRSHTGETAPRPRNHQERCREEYSSKRFRH
jgi:hypothetical protein